MRVFGEHSRERAEILRSTSDVDGLPFCVSQDAKLDFAPFVMTLLQTANLDRLQVASFVICWYWAINLGILITVVGLLLSILVAATAEFCT
jgi:hypothetical protein